VATNEQGDSDGLRLAQCRFPGIATHHPEAWLAAQLENRVEFPSIPTLIDGVDDLEDSTRTQLTASIQPSDWDELMLACPDQVEAGMRGCNTGGLP